ncbi:Uncharacterised protein [Chryseobacterium taklimakanense]|uniref:DUF2345 domain-containing protein n=1 Tax=Chryseobacterium taklimakanense TaxID=536441 RepID=A0A239WKS9_9FLAO|nr:hypothetical protein [Chryseobacterium taklimakanense]SNV34809.1 Uncharacterised protein [Chryseobacterium taklimakanense]
MTRSTHKIIFTEDESILITDKSGNEIHLDTTGSNINITAPETINIKCKSFNIDVDENMNTSVGQNQRVSTKLQRRNNNHKKNSCRKPKFKKIPQ